MKKWEISILIGVAAVILWCAAPPVTFWWTSAFSPLCDGILIGGSGTEGEILLKSRLWELLSQLVFAVEAT